MDRFEHAFPYLLDGEERIGRSRNIRIYEGDTKTTYEGGDLLLTSHRLIWGAPGLGAYRSFTMNDLHSNQTKMVKKIVYGGHSYVRHKSLKEGERWVCSKRATYQGAIKVRVGRDPELLKELNHERNIPEVEMTREVEAAKFH